MEVVFLDRVPLCVSRGKMATAQGLTHKDPRVSDEVGCGGGMGGGRHETKTGSRGPSTAWGLLGCGVVFRGLHRGGWAGMGGGPESSLVG